MTTWGIAEFNEWLESGAPEGASVETLDLTSQAFTGEFTPLVGRLSGLRTLRLCNNNIASLPAEIGLLGQLEHLEVVENDLQTLPPEIGNLRNLQTIWLSYNDITSLPTEICSLARLERLYLVGNDLQTLPPEIGNLQNLQVLNVRLNQLSSIPPEIGNLSHLTDLFLDNNFLTVLPDEIGNLSSLRYLTCHQNDLTAFPMVRFAHTNEEDYTEVLIDARLYSVTGDLDCYSRPRFVGEVEDFSYADCKCYFVYMHEENVRAGIHRANIVDTKPAISSASM